jgi:hypothetical protein
MSELSAFFKGSGTELGIFYPSGYLVAVFQDLPGAEHAVKLLRYAGFTEEDAIATSGRDVIRTEDEQVKKEGAWGLLMRELSRLIGTEEVYTDKDLKRAAEGAGFVAVHCPTEASKNSAWEVLKPLSPVAARLYGLGGIEHLAGEF